MLKKFHNIELNNITSTMLDFWEKDFDNAIEKYINFLKENVESQDKYSSKFSEILEKMDIFQNDENEEARDDNQDEGLKIHQMMMDKMTLRIKRKKIKRKKLKLAFR